MHVYTTMNKVRDANLPAFNTSRE